MIHTMPNSRSHIELSPHTQSGERPDSYVLVEVKGPYGYAQGKTPAVVRACLSYDDGWVNGWVALAG